MGPGVSSLTATAAIAIIGASNTKAPPLAMTSKVRLKIRLRDKLASYSFQFVERA